MAIKKIKISNFKSFKDLEVELGNFNVLIGANASGKSNFIQIFKFLRDITNYGLDNAISMQGGVEYLRNLSIGSSMNFSLEVIAEPKLETIFEKEKKLVCVRTDEGIYKFSIGFKKKGPGFEIPNERVIQKCRFIRVKKQREKTEEKEELWKGKFIFSKMDGKLKLDVKPPAGLPIDISKPLFEEEKVPPKTLFLFSSKHHTHYPLLCPLTLVFDNTSIYDFDPTFAKKAPPITGKAELEEDGSNLALVLKNVIENREKKRKFSNLIKDLLPFVEDIDTEKFADKSLLFKLQEVYFKEYLPAFLISDGTINITALIIALYFEKKPLIIIEEPERNIHPSLISKVIDMMKETSQKKQIIVTTHNPEVIKHAGLENILLVSRDKEGFSLISRPSDREEVKTFLKNEIGIEELYVQDLLGV